MTADAIVILQTLFNTIWSLTTCFDIPGTHMTPAEWAIFVMTFVVVIRFIKRIAGDAFGAYSERSDKGE